MQSALAPLLAEIESLSGRIAEYNDRIEGLAAQSYPQVALLKQIKGVGTLIALTFLLTLEDPHRFEKAATLAAIWDYSPDAGTRASASRRCISARRATRIYVRCWCRGRSISGPVWHRL